MNRDPPLRFGTMIATRRVMSEISGNFRAGIVIYSDEVMMMMMMI
jgi:hypothetical protein